VIATEVMMNKMIIEDEEAAEEAMAIMEDVKKIIEGKEMKLSTEEDRLENIVVEDMIAIEGNVDSMVVPQAEVLVEDHLIAEV